MAHRMKPLTKRQREILDYAALYIEDNGYAPTITEICEYFNLSSVSTVHRHLVNLERKGAIERFPNEDRSIRVLEV